MRAHVTRAICFHFIDQSKPPGGVVSLSLVLGRQSVGRVGEHRLEEQRIQVPAGIAVLPSSWAWPASGPTVT